MIDREPIIHGVCGEYHAEGFCYDERVAEIATLKAERDKAVELLRKADELSLKGLPAGIRWMNSVHKLLEEIDD